MGSIRAKPELAVVAKNASADDLMFTLKSRPAAVHILHHAVLYAIVIARENHRTVLRHVCSEAKLQGTQSYVSPFDMENFLSNRCLRENLVQVPASRFPDVKHMVWNIGKESAGRQLIGLQHL